MKSDPKNNLISKLYLFRDELEVLEQLESKSAVIKRLDDLIASLSRLRARLALTSIEGKAAEIRKPLEQVIAFLEFAKSDESLKTLLSLARKDLPPKAKRQPVEISQNLTNEQIRALLEKDLSKIELKTIAVQRGISVGKSKIEEIRRDILKNLERQEGYGRLTFS